MKAAYAETDHMPREVATALLTTPGTRLTPAMRRSCRNARIQALASHCPIVRGAKNGEYVYDTAKMGKPGYEKFPATLVKLGIVALSRRLKRATAHRRSLEYAFLDSTDEAKRQEILQLAVRLDKQLGVFLAEITRRNKWSTVANHKAKKQYARSL